MNLLQLLNKPEPNIKIISFSDTSRPKGEGEIDGADYHFVSRSQFEEDVKGRRFVEHGEFEKVS